MATRTSLPTIAILSGKGGTGKTLLAVNLAAVAGTATYIDCDVEEPNGNLYFKPSDKKTTEVSVLIPKVDDQRCNACHTCVDFCAFHALALIGKNLMVFEEVCHSCGGCILACPEQALFEEDKTIGTIETGRSDNVRTITGTLDVGHDSGVPIVKQLLTIEREGMTFIDCPPGSSCMVMESIADADFCLLVAEPTIFGVHNLAMVLELVILMGKKHAVILNKCMEGENPAEEFCKQHNVPIIGSLPFDKKLGALHSQALIASREKSEFQKLFSSILQTIRKELDHETVAVAQR